MMKIYIFSDYKADWIKMKQKKLEEKEKHEEDTEKELLKSPGIGETIPLVTSISAGRELADIYLKHPANESSEDSEGEEAPANQEDGTFLRSIFVIYSIRNIHYDFKISFIFCIDNEKDKNAFQEFLRREILKREAQTQKPEFLNKEAEIQKPGPSSQP